MRQKVSRRMFSTLLECVVLLINDPMKGFDTSAILGEMPSFVVWMKIYACWSVLGIRFLSIDLVSASSTNCSKALVFILFGYREIR